MELHNRAMQNRLHKRIWQIDEKDSRGVCEVFHIGRRVENVLDEVVVVGNREPWTLSMYLQMHR